MHSFCNIAHVDLQYQKDGSAYQPNRILKTLNKFCQKADIGLVVNCVEAVPSTFHSRYSSFYRHYLYRIGITDLKVQPIIEWRKCYFVEKPFCVEKATEVCKFLEGTKNFASFCHGLGNLRPEYPTVRTLDLFDIKPGRPLFDPIYDPLYCNIAFYDFHVKAASFMYKQVRRMVSVAVAVAQNRMELGEVRELIDNPGKWNSKATTAPAYGLYLLNVDYKIPEDEQPQRSTKN